MEFKKSTEILQKNYKMFTTSVQKKNIGHKKGTQKMYALRV